MPTPIMVMYLGPDGESVPVSTDNPLPTSGGGGGMAPDDITAVAPATWDPETATIGVAVGTTAGTVAAGNDSRLSQGAANVATVRTLGTGSTQAAPGDHTHAALTPDQDASTPSVRTLGTGATQAAPGNHTGHMLGSATVLPDSTAADLESLVGDFNALLATLRARGVIAES